VLLVSTKDLASHVGLTTQRITQYGDQGMPKKDRNQWDLHVCCRWIRRYEQELREKEEGKKYTEADYYKEQTRYTSARAELAEDRLRRERGDLVPLPQLLPLLDRIFRSVNSGFLGLGASVSPLLEGISVAERKKLIDKEVRARLTQLAQSKPSKVALRRLGAIESADLRAADAAAGDDAEPVGRRKAVHKSGVEPE
jgi:phage terminase Nu1 subunit (DNA packaging protein)